MAKIELDHVNSWYDPRQRRWRYVLRLPGQRAKELPRDPASEAFMEKYHDLLRGGAAPIAIGARNVTPGTVNALAVAHYESTYFKGLALVTQKERRRTIERFRDKHGDKRVATVQKHNIESRLAKIAKPTMKWHWLKAIRALFESAIPTMRTDNPTAGISIDLPKSKGHHTWTEDEVAQYRAYWPNGTEARLALEFAFEAYSRRCEVVRLGRQHVRPAAKPGEARRIKIERAKGSDPVDMEVSPDLGAAIDAMPVTGHLNFMVDETGKPRTDKWLGAQFAKWATAAKLPARCRLHGLKKAGMTQGAHDGMSPYELMADSGHRDIESVLIYTREVDKRRLSDNAAAKRRAGREARAK